MKFSELFKLATTQADNWFDPVLSVDTPLFIDPFLIYDQERGPFRGSHAEIVRFFKQMFTLIAKSGGNKQSTRYLKAVDDLIFPEVAELCLGYTQSGTKGAGSGSELGRLMAGAIWDAIETGLHNIKHFEEVAILRENIGPDRISDATANLLRHRLAAYTDRSVGGIGYRSKKFATLGPATTRRVNAGYPAVSSCQLTHTTANLFFLYQSITSVISLPLIPLISGNTALTTKLTVSAGSSTWTSLEMCPRAKSWKLPGNTLIG